jgi:hypothetical protein
MHNMHNGLSFGLHVLLLSLANGTLVHGIGVLGPQLFCTLQARLV